MLPGILVIASALIVLTLGLLHLVMTFSGPKFRPAGFALSLASR